MNRVEFRQLAEDRLLDAQTLLGAGRWSAAYYLGGYAVECGLKACVLAHVDREGAFFLFDKEQKRFSDECFTHDLKKLIKLSGLSAKLDQQSLNNRFNTFWSLVIKWSEESRYQQVKQADAQELLEAITDNQDGVFPWIKTHW